MIFPDDNEKDVEEITPEKARAEDIRIEKG